MADIRFSFDHSCISGAQQAAHFFSLRSVITQICADRAKQHESIYAALYCPFDQAALKQMYALFEQYATIDYAAVVVVGIGGSSMGARAIASISSKQLLWVETVDSDELYQALGSLSALLASGKKIIIIIASKSGTTTETVVNAHIIIDLMRQYFPESYQRYIVIITDSGSPLEAIAHAHQFAVLSISPAVGGRFSVFSAVGLFPLLLAGVDIEQLLEGARDGFEHATNSLVDHNYAARSAAIKVAQYQHDITLFDMFIFSTAYADFGLWYRQLFAESIGKKYDRNGAVVEIGMTPTVSIGSADLHSIAQRYLGGARSLFTTFLVIEKNNHDVMIPDDDFFSACLKRKKNMSVSSVMQAIVAGTQHAYAVDHRPFISVTIPEKSAYLLGKLMQLYMHEVVYICYLLNVDPFDQPDVEAYKKETRRLLR